MKNLSEFATREVVTVDRDTSVFDAARVMRHGDVGTVVVVEERAGRQVPLGILTDRDIVYEVVALDLEASDLTVGDIMSLDLVTMDQDSDLPGALELMGAQGIRRVPLVDGEGGLVGIFSLDDALEQVTSELENMLVLIRRQRKPGQTTRAA